jgi:hypothetical protein
MISFAKSCHVGPVTAHHPRAPSRGTRGRSSSTYPPWLATEHSRQIRINGWESRVMRVLWVKGLTAWLQTKSRNVMIPITAKAAAISAQEVPMFIASPPFAPTSEPMARWQYLIRG